MSQHEQVVAEMRRFKNERSDCAIISPTVLAVAAYDKFATEPVEPHLQWGCIEHFKSIARSVLRSEYDVASDDNPAFIEQGELFSGHLQDRYALPRKTGEEPQYKKRSMLTMEERRKIGGKFHKCGRAWIDHGDALIAEGEALEASSAAA